jgi:hypothetical protein
MARRSMHHSAVNGCRLIEMVTTGSFRLRFLDSTRYLLKMNYTLDLLLQLGGEYTHCDSP